MYLINQHELVWKHLCGCLGGRGRGHDGALTALLSGGWPQITAPEALGPDIGSLRTLCPCGLICGQQGVGAGPETHNSKNKIVFP